METITEKQTEKQSIIAMRIIGNDGELIDRLSKDLELNKSDVLRYALHNFESLAEANEKIGKSYEEQSLMVKGMMNLLIKIISALPQDHNDPQIKSALVEYQEKYGHLFRE